MNRFAGLLLTTAAFVGGFAACGGDDEAQTVQPQTRGERGESCEARNDCVSGLACINHTCSKNDFDVKSTAKHCDKVDCATNEDCCGGRPTEAPAKCQNRASICSSSQLPGCTSSLSCESDNECGGGECGTGQCSNTFSSCDANSDCSDTCNTSTGFCNQQSGRSCTTSAQCTGTCESRRCDCTNPQYDPSDPICSDPDCTEDVCRLKCEDEACVVDVSCEEDMDCLGSGTGRHCESGACVECTDDEECTGEGESCVENRCKAACTQNEECPLFHSCTGGTCVETGCTSDRECILAVGRNGESGEDARLAKCLPSAADANVKECKIPCENDGACGSELEVCEGGFCKFVGCDSDEECRSYLGLANETSNPAQPWISKAVCRD